MITGEYSDKHLERNKTLISELTRISNEFKCNKQELDSIFEQLLLIKYKYKDVKSSNKSYYFNIYYIEGLFSISTNIFSTGVSYLSSGIFEERCSISFNRQHKIIDITFVADNRRISRGNENDRRYIFIFDNNCLLREYSSMYRKNGEIFGSDIVDTGLTNEEFFFLLNLKFCTHEGLNELLPELRTPSAYNFSSQSYKDRLHTAEMMLF